MNKNEAIEGAVKIVKNTGVTQFVARRGSQYAVYTSQAPTPRGWKVAEMISKGNIHNYQKNPFA
jgi:uncharacterized protein YbdZ (MbtH family)